MVCRAVVRLCCDADESYSSWGYAIFSSTGLAGRCHCAISGTSTDGRAPRLELYRYGVQTFGEQKAVTVQGPDMPNASSKGGVQPANFT